jgi:hypothetical protein
VGVGWNPLITGMHKLVSKAEERVEKSQPLGESLGARNRNDLIQLASCALLAKRYKESVGFLWEMINLNETHYMPMALDEQAVLIKATEQQILSLRTACYKMNELIIQYSILLEESDPITAKNEWCADQLGMVKEKLRIIGKIKTECCQEGNAVCNHLLDIHEKELSLKSSYGRSDSDSDAEPTEKDLEKIEVHALWLKSRADMHRYRAEMQSLRHASIDSANHEDSDKALVLYLVAKKFSASKLPGANPVRLGVALNFAVAYWEIIGDGRKAIATANTGVADALECLSEEHGKRHESSTFLIQMLQKNIGELRTECQN